MHTAIHSLSRVSFLTRRRPASGWKLYQHQKCPDDDEHKAEGGFFGQVLLEHQRRKADRNQNAQLVDRHHDAGQAVLQRLIIAEPGGSGGQARQADKAELPFRNLLQGVLLALDPNDQPCHNQHDTGTDGRAEIGFHAVDADFSEYGGQAGEHGREHRVKQPAFLLLLVPGIGLLLHHQEGAGSDQHHGHPREPADGLPEENQRQQDGKDGRGLIDRYDLVDIAELQCTEIAEPGGSGGQAGENQKHPGFDTE